MDIEKLKYEWQQEEDNTFSGWDFSHLDGRWESETLRWDYKKIVASTLNRSDRLLDMGTGGGEFLLGLNHPYNLTSATEGYLRNYKLCMEKLAPLGIDVRLIENNSEIPFDDSSFDIVINRHESFDVKEVRRVLKPGGLFITQQVGGKNNRDLSEKLISNFRPRYPHFTLQNTVSKFKSNGFDIFISDEQLSELKFFDVGAIVYYAKIIEWEFPDFSVYSNFDRLLVLHKEIEQKGFIQSAEHRFIIVARSN